MLIHQEKSEEVNLLVDSGAIFTSISRDILEDLGLKPIDRERRDFDILLTKFPLVLDRFPKDALP